MRRPALIGAPAALDLRRRGRGDRGRARRHRRRHRAPAARRSARTSAPTQRVLAAHPRCFGAAAHDPRRPCANPRCARGRAVAAARRASCPTRRATSSSGPAASASARSARRRARPKGTSRSSATATRRTGARRSSAWRGPGGWRGLSITRTAARSRRRRGPRAGARALRPVEPRRGAWLARHPRVTPCSSPALRRRRARRRGGRRFAAEVGASPSAWSALPRVGQAHHRDPRHAGCAATRDCVEEAIAGEQRPGRRARAARGPALQPDPARRGRAGPADRLRVVDLTRYLCDDRRCPPVIGGALVYKDATTSPRSTPRRWARSCAVRSTR